MNDLSQLLESLPAYAKDIKLNLSTLFAEQNSANLSMAQQYLIALACAYAIKQAEVIKIVEGLAQPLLDENSVNAAKAATTIMAMNNIYYRFTHLVSDKAYSQMPAKLRMNIIANPGVPKIDFELACLAVSALNGCGLCIDSHVKVLRDNQVSAEMIQQAIRIGAVLNALGQVLEIEKLQRN